MDAVETESDIEDSLPSSTSIAASQVIHIEQESEEEMYIPFTFVDVNGTTDLDLELDVDSHPSSPFTDVNQEEALIPLNFDTLKSEDKEEQLDSKAVLKAEDEQLVEEPGFEMDLESVSTLRRIATFHCRVCNKGFMHRTDLKTHSRTHTGWVNYTRVHLSHKSHLIDHSYCITGSKTQFCHLCNKEFTKLQEHFRTHTGEKPYKCEKCGREFSIRGSLKRHYTVHTGEKRHQCNICFKRLSTKRSLSNHMLLHEKRLYECHVCHVKFSRLKTLNIHSRLYCGQKRRNTSGHSVKNKLQSLQKKRIRCEICLKRFSNKGNLFQHYRIHEKEEPWNLMTRNLLKCEVCSKQFSSASTLKRHSRMHT